MCFAVAVAGSLVDHPFSYTNRQQRRRIFLRREGRIGQSGQVIRQPPIHRRQICNTHILIDPSFTRVDQWITTSPGLEDFQHLTGCRRDRCLAVQAGNLAVQHGPIVTPICAGRDAEEVIGLCLGRFPKVGNVIGQAIQPNPLRLGKRPGEPGIRIAPTDPGTNPNKLRTIWMLHKFIKVKQNRPVG